MLNWNPDLVSALVDSYVAAMREAGVGIQKKRIYKQLAEQVQNRTGFLVTGEQVNAFALVIKRGRYNTFIRQFTLIDLFS